jgi:glycosyltransferase involved in cell wall biosynthesis
MLTSIFPPDIGGPSIHIYELSKRLAKNDNEIHVVTFGKKRIIKKSKNLFIHRIGKFKHFSIRIIKTGIYVSELVKKFNIQLIYVQGSIMGLSAYLANKISRKPYVMKIVGGWVWDIAFTKKWTTKHMHEFYRRKNFNLFLKIILFFQKIVGNKSSPIIVPSSYLKNIVKKWSKNKNIVVIPNAVEIPKFNLIKKEMKNKLSLKNNIILTAGRLVPWKRFDDIIKSMPAILRKYPETKLLIIGDGEEKISLEEITKKLGLEKNISFLGSLHHKQLLQYMYAADMFVLPSLYEGMSHVLLEAMACKTPVIATNVCGNKEIVEHKSNGILVKPKNTNELQKAIINLLQNKKTASKYAETAYDAVSKKNNWNNLITKLEKQFEMAK